MSIAIDISIEAESWEQMAGVENAVRRAAEAALRASAVQAAEVSIVLSDNEHVRELNKHHRGIDKPTNVLSFPAAKRVPASASAPRFFGDIVLAYETVADEARGETKPAENHVAHLVVHGVLHLLGHDHEDDAEAEAMEHRERAILSSLGIPDPYAERGTDAAEPA